MTQVRQTTPKHCRAIRKDGQPCTAPTLSDAGFCFAHDPDRAAERLAARQKGGQEHANRARLRGLVPPRLLSVYDTLEAALIAVRDGSLDPKQASAMANVARAMQVSARFDTITFPHMRTFTLSPFDSIPSST